MCEGCMCNKDGECTRVNRYGENECWMAYGSGEY